MAIDTHAPPTPPPPPAGPPPLTARRGAGVAVASPQAVRVRRRWGRVAAGMLLALLGAWISAGLYISVGDRDEVLVLARDVDQYQEITDDDIRTARVGTESDVETIPAGQRDEVVGRISAVALHEGNLLAGNQLLQEDATPVAPDEGIVATELEAGEFPASRAKAGTDVDVIVRPEVGSDEGVRTIPGWLLSVSDPDEDSDDRIVEIVVPAADAAAVGAASSDDRLSLVARVD